MAYPEHLLSPDEEVVTEFRPHWTAILPQLGITLVALVAVVASLVLLNPPARSWTALGILVVWLVLVIRGLADWWFTQHVVTNERVIHRQGVISKKGREIPLEMINSVSFSQTLFERMVGSGDLIIESAAETGQTRYTDIPHPERLQTQIYVSREARMFELERGGSSGGEGGSQATVAQQLEILSRLHDQGKLTDEEFETQKRGLLDPG